MPFVGQQFHKNNSLSSLYENVSVFGVFLVPYFPTLGLNREVSTVNLSIQSECEKMHTRKIPNAGTFQAVHQHHHHHHYHHHYHQSKHVMSIISFTFCLRKMSSRVCNYYLKISFPRVSCYESALFGFILNKYFRIYDSIL